MTNTPSAHDLALLSINRIAQLHPNEPLGNQLLLMTIGMLCQVIVESGNVDDYTLQTLLKHLSEY
jgi:hypothetical protein